MLGSLNGYKTYITGICALLGAWGAVYAGSMTVDQAVQMTETAVMAMFVRHGISTGA